MLIHRAKSKYLAVNTVDNTSFRVADIEITYTDSYCYLGYLIAGLIAANPVAKQVQEDMKRRHCHIFKYRNSFLRKNYIMHRPFSVKKKVLQAAVENDILYGCESWRTANIRPVESAFRDCLKVLLGVRNQTPSDLLYIDWLHTSGSACQNKTT